MAPQKTLNDIPTEAKADEIVRSFENEGCTAEKTRQPDGNYTVTADCPEAAATAGDNPQAAGRSRVLRDIPPDRVGQVVSDFKGEGAETEKIKQENGNFTVVAKFS